MARSCSALHCKNQDHIGGGPRRPGQPDPAARASSAAQTAHREEDRKHELALDGHVVLRSTGLGRELAEDGAALVGSA